MKIRNLLLALIASLLLVACNASKEVPYMRNIDEIPIAALSEAVAQAGDFSIKPGDMLQITVSATNEDVVAPFNKIQYVSSGISTNMGDRAVVFYLVDDDGNIDFPVVGKLHIVGMTKASVEKYITSMIYPKYITEMPVVECRIENFRIFCLGEFNHGGVVSATNGRLNLIEAIAMAGDLTFQGRRDNILLIRTDSNGQRTVKRININDANFISSPEFHLQQNDILYVEPNKYKARSVWSVPPVYSFAIGALGTAMSIFTFIAVRTK